MEEHIVLEIENKINTVFNDKGLLKTSLTHRSYLNEVKIANLEHNERLEFLGDAVLELLVTEYLFFTYPDRPEGELTSFRSATVKTESLAESFADLDLSQYIFMSKGEENTGGRERPYILANTFEAVLGAIYIDQGYDVAKAFVTRYLLPKISQIVELRLDIDGKSKLQEQAQEHLRFTPVYELISESGPDHDKSFIMGVLLGDHTFAKGSGKSKQQAEQDAATKALEVWDEQVKKYFPNQTEE